MRTCYKFRPRTMRHLVSMMLVCAMLHAVVSFGKCHSGPSNRNAILSEYQRLFGPPATGSDSTFEVNPAYALQLEFSAQGELSRIAVVPKYWLSDPQPWADPGTRVSLAPQEVANLWARIRSITPIGKEIRTGTAGIATNLQTWFLDEYEHAYVRRASPTDIQASEASGELEYRALYVYPFRKVKGEVEDMRVLDVLGIEEHYQVRIRDEWYMVRHADWNKVRMLSCVEIEVAGPVIGF